MISVNIHEAKARFSELLQLMEKGEIVQICRRNEPLATLVPVEKKLKKKRVFGLNISGIKMSDDAFDPMSEEELSLWYDNPLNSNDLPSEKL